MVRLLHIFRLLVLTLVLASTSFMSSFASPTEAPENNPKHQTSEFSFDQSDMKFEMPSGIQTDLPQMNPVVKRIRPPKQPLFDLGFLAPILQLIFYGLLAAAVLFILYLIVNSMVIAKRNLAPIIKTEDAAEIPTYRPDKKTARVLLDDADKLAAEGKFEEAVHLLLYRSIQDIETRCPHHIKGSLTAREIAVLKILSKKAKASFALIGHLVETSFFGGRALDAQDYDASKTAYKAFAFERPVS